MHYFKYTLNRDEPADEDVDFNGYVKNSNTD